MSTQKYSENEVSFYGGETIPFLENIYPSIDVTILYLMKSIIVTRTSYDVLEYSLIVVLYGEIKPSHEVFVGTLPELTKGNFNLTYERILLSSLHTTVYFGIT